MTIKNNNIIKFFKPYIVSVILFIFGGFLFNTIESILFWQYQDSISFITILQSYFNITVTICLYSLIVLPIYLLVYFLHEKTAQILLSVLFSILLLLEIGLFMYYKQTDVLMGTELIIRPFLEILLTIRNSSNMALNVLLGLIIFAYFIILPFLSKKIKIFNNLSSIVAGIITIVVFSVCTVFYQKNEDKTINNYLESKSFYFFSSLINYITDKSETNHPIFYEEKENIAQIEKNEAILKEYFGLYPTRTISDSAYPMERPSSEIPDVLSSYFNTAEKQPNIVIIIVESLGSYLMGEKGENVSFTPFLDSLANTGLYWKNCLSTTPRTFGVVPAVIGSVPHGMRGFQFGVMPKHYSLFTLLKDNHYATNFFHGSNSNFDNMLDFLTVQEPDHIDDFQSRMKTFRKNKQANWWGLYDHVLFEESFKYLKTIPNQKAKANVYLTLTTHDPFNNDNIELKKYYEEKTERIFSKLDIKQEKQFLPIKDIIVPFTYLDDCMRLLINYYSKQPDFENTIFIITGDHSFGIHKNDLAHYSVPLIIWSPLLKIPKTFPSIVSHWAITPSVISFLQNSYNLKVPDNISWCSDGLDTASVFKPSEKHLFLNYERKVNSMVYNQYYFEASSKQLYKIDEALDLEAVDDSLLIESMNAKFNTLKYVNNYVYHNNKLIKSNNPSDKDYKIIKSYISQDSIICKTSDTIPSIHGIETFDIMPVEKIKGKYKKIKIKLTANIVINDLMFQDEYMTLNFICLGENYEYISKENISKYIASDNIECNKKYELFIEKEIVVNDLEKCSIHICVRTNEYDYYWKPDKKMTLSNIKVLIQGK